MDWTWNGATLVGCCLEDWQKAMGRLLFDAEVSFQRNFLCVVTAKGGRLDCLAHPF
jgi:hypothetical protein